jgi:hypothetical protein
VKNAKITCFYRLNSTKPGAIVVNTWCNSPAIYTSINDMITIFLITTHSLIWFLNENLISTRHF